MYFLTGVVVADVVVVFADQEKFENASYILRLDLRQHSQH